MRTRLVSLAARQELRFVAVGGLNTLVGLGLFALFHVLFGGRAGYLGTLLSTYVVGTLFAFAMQRWLVFRVRGQALADLARFTTVQLAALGLNAVVLTFLVEVLALPVIVGQVCALAVVTASAYFAHLLFSFRRTPVAGVESVPSEVRPGADCHD
jgi:putative flippase GtrA